MRSYIINRLLKPKYIKIIKAEGYPFTIKIKNINILYEQMNNYKDTKNILCPSKPILIDNHGLKRWNERVGPIICLDSLQKSLEIIFRNCSYRIDQLAHGIGSIDNDIVFTYENTEKLFRITTFYGRKNLHPSLNQVQNLRRYNLYSNEYVNLALTTEEICRQNLPLIPKEMIHFQGRITSYILEKYLISNRKLPCFLCYSKDNKSNDYYSFVIDLENPEEMMIPNNVLYLLNKLGYSDFILKYFSYHNPEKLDRARSKALDYYMTSMHNGIFFH
ncbi:hypothetical protein ACE198_13600 [Neobacillus sp. KR4-4]|uniref:hypothetical protein n=1 Tax=Neobacillus sp. KR4-4 TaxID=3344872 RepID=UPI0035CA9956